MALHTNGAALPRVRRREAGDETPLPKVASPRWTLSGAKKLEIAGGGRNLEYHLRNKQEMKRGREGVPLLRSKQIKIY